MAIDNLNNNPPNKINNAIEYDFDDDEYIDIILPSSLQKVQNILQTTIGDHHHYKYFDEEEDDDFIIMEFVSSSSTSSPLRNNASNNHHHHQEKSLIITKKIKAYMAYLKALFMRKYECKDASSSEITCYCNNSIEIDKQVSNGKSFQMKSKRVEHKKTIFGHKRMWRSSSHPNMPSVIKKSNKQEALEGKVSDNSNSQRSLSFSSAQITKKQWPIIKCLAPSSYVASTSSSSFSSLSSISFSLSDDFYELNLY